MDAVTKLKLKVIKDFDFYIKRLNKGYVIDNTSIKNDIFFIQSFMYLDNVDAIYEYLINN